MPITGQEYKGTPSNLKVRGDGRELEAVLFDAEETGFVENVWIAGEVEGQVCAMAVTDDDRGRTV